MYKAISHSIQQINFFSFPSFFLFFWPKSIFRPSLNRGTSNPEHLILRRTNSTNTTAQHWINSETLIVIHDGTEAAVIVVVVEVVVLLVILVIVVTVGVVVVVLIVVVVVSVDNLVDALPTNYWCIYRLSVEKERKDKKKEKKDVGRAVMGVGN